jgi:hypothetical protein
MFGVFCISDKVFAGFFILIAPKKVKKNENDEI